MSGDKRKVVYVLGAGFSFGTEHEVSWGHSKLSMPLQNDLLEKIFKFNSRVIHDLDPLAKTIRTYFNPKGYRSKRGVGASRHKDLNGLSVEEVVTFFEEMIRDSDGTNKNSFRIAETKLRRLTLELIEYLSINGEPNRNAILKAFRNDILATDTIITFNWDTLLDRVLANNKNKSRQWHPAWGYGRAVGKLFTYQGRKVLKSPNKHATLLKLHGSINWLANDNNFTIPVRFSSNGNLDDVVMMPPKMLKREIWGEEPTELPTAPARGNWAVHTKGLYKKLWHEAEESMSIAKKIVFIGYSFPAADTSVFGLIRRSLSKAKAGDGEYPEIRIVDPEAASLSKKFIQSFQIEIPSKHQYLTLSSYVRKESRK